MASSRRRRPAQEMRELLISYFVPPMLYTVAKLGIADVLAKGPLTPEAIAKRVSAHAPFLRRVLRALASVGVFAEVSSGLCSAKTPSADKATGSSFMIATA